MTEQRDIEDGGVTLRVWWVPQVPMSAFFHAVATIEAGELLISALGKYDIFQFEQNIKSDFFNAGGMAWRHSEYTDGDWRVFDPEDELERADVQDAMLKARTKEGE